MSSATCSSISPSWAIRGQSSQLSTIASECGRLVVMTTTLGTSPDRGVRFLLDIVTGLGLDIHMNRNSNTITTAILHDGRSVVIAHRNSIGGWANAIARKGLTISDIASVVAGLPESDRVR